MDRLYRVIALVIVLCVVRRIEREREWFVWHEERGFHGILNLSLSRRIVFPIFSLSLSLAPPIFGRLNDISIRLAVYFRSVCRHARAPTKFERGVTQSP